MDFVAETAGRGVGNILRGAGQVIGIYDQVVNIELATGFCLSLVSKKIDLAPNRILLAGLDCIHRQVKPGDMVRVGSHQLWHTRFSIAWAAPPSQESIELTPLLASLGTLEKELRTGTGACRSYFSDSVGSFIDNQVAVEAKNLAAGSDGESLLGLGAGLTPAGDDVLVGYLGACNQLGLEPGVANGFVGKAFLVTGSLSATAIYFASQGQVQERLSAVIQALSGSQSELTINARTLMQVGSSSGSDMLLGVYLALVKYFNQIGSEIA
ncbi:MAG: DUF2877 domain-containing protein [Firmicutes bacterium]|nr:DUF2877 domain-containing protein [Bacillota bacterium]